MSNMENTRTEQNGLGLLDAPSDKLLDAANGRMEMSANPVQDVSRSVPERTGTVFI